MTIKLPKNYGIELRPTGNSGWIDDKRRGKAQSFICYRDGTTAFDSPGALPQAVKISIRRYCSTRKRKP